MTPHVHDGSVWIVVGVDRGWSSWMMMGVRRWSVKDSACGWWRW
eukprot:CAMPEP_0179432454 /NCGR_PEP_ID=MMETSP0799-20121207/17060_1 /TAXON_ID=46947 /ORGANISM="Geminigera cryophila, Strain CCMP2564" /LENGTH=43 /DNA_ID= /DNA_START= /DNA_END= /DNA_ORIENTATION=